VTSRCVCLYALSNCHVTSRCVCLNALSNCHVTSRCVCLYALSNCHVTSRCVCLYVLSNCHVTSRCVCLYVLSNCHVTSRQTHAAPQYKSFSVFFLLFFPSFLPFAFPKLQTVSNVAVLCLAHFYKCRCLVPGTLLQIPEIPAPNFSPHFGCHDW
jgi:hypothetical protein